MSEWQVKRLAEMCETITVGHVGSMASQYVASGIPFLRSQNVRAGRLDMAGLKSIPAEFHQQLRKSQLRAGDVVIVRTGQPGAAALIPPDIGELNCSDLVIARPAKSVDPRFLCYSINATSGHYVAAHLVGAVQQHFNVGSARNMQLPAPPLHEQRAIAEALTALDDKMAVNERIAQTAAQLALAHGQYALGQAGGDEVALADHALIAKGLSYRSADLRSGSDRLVTLKCVGRDGTFRVDGLKAYAGEYKESQVVSNGDIVVAQTDLTQRGEVIGRPVRVSTMDQPGQLVASLDLLIVRPGPLLSRQVLFALLSTQDFRDHASAYCNGTTVLHMGARALPDYRFCMPSSETVSMVTQVMAPLLDRSDGAQRECHVLSQLRNALLPKLMSGEIRVRDAEKAVEDAV